jgi:transposase-like protein
VKNALDLPYNTLWNWLNSRRSESPTGHEADKPQEDDPQLLRSRIRELEQRVHRLEMEKDILKKATAYFAREQT